MNSFTRELQAEKQSYAISKAYFTSIRRPFLEWLTFAICLLLSIAMSGRFLGWWLQMDQIGDWLFYGYILSLVAFVGQDSIFTMKKHPVSVPFGDFNVQRVHEKFAIQGRTWQLLLILIIPATAKLVGAFIFTANAG